MEANSLSKDDNIPAVTKINSTRNGRSSSNSLFMALLAIFVVSVFRMAVHEFTHVQEQLRELHSPHHLDMKRFTQMTPDHDFQAKNSNEESFKKENASGNSESEVQPYIEILQRAGVDLSADPELVKRLPLRSEVADLYGSEPVIIGLDTCKAFRETIDPGDAYVGPAGMFNSGTNLMSSYLGNNCRLPARQKKHDKGQTGMRWQVPWGKHTPVSWRGKHVAMAGGKGVVQTDVLPVVTIKDPYTWMGSMCRNSYSANWRHVKEHCPNLVANDVDRKEWHNIPDVVPVNVRYTSENATHHESLLGLWNDWYEEWYRVSFPRLIVRFEDLLFHPEEVLTQVCQCAGGEMNESFSYTVESAKQGQAHQGSSGMISAMVRYGNPQKRISDITEDDLMFVKKTVDMDVMKAFNYKIA